MVVLYLCGALDYLGSYLKSKVFQVSLIIVWEGRESLASYSLIPVNIPSLTPRQTNWTVQEHAMVLPSAVPW